MYFKYQLYVIAVILVSAGKTVQALKCYNCDSVSTEASACADPIDTSKLTPIDCAVSNILCYKTKTTNNGVSVVTRHCGPKAVCTIASQAPNTFCETCETDLCNSSVGLGSSVILSVAMCVILKFY